MQSESSLSPTRGKMYPHIENSHIQYNTNQRKRELIFLIYLFHNYPAFCLSKPVISSNKTIVLVEILLCLIHFAAQHELPFNAPSAIHEFKGSIYEIPDYNSYRRQFIEFALQTHYIISPKKSQWICSKNSFIIKFVYI